MHRKRGLVDNPLSFPTGLFRLLKALDSGDAGGNTGAPSLSDDWTPP